MNLEFHSVSDPATPLIQHVAESDPANPFYTPEYVQARQSMGASAWFLGLKEGGTLCGDIGFLSGGPFSRTLDIPSFREPEDGAIFWRGITDFCHQQRIWRLQVDTYGSRGCHIPQMTGEVTRRPRCEHVLDLTPENIFDRLSGQHRHNLSRAVKAGLTIRRNGEPAALEQHISMVNFSVKRRLRRGERLRASSADIIRALLKSGSGELFQAVRGSRVLSSILVLRSKCGAYGHSTGTAPEGLKQGASSFLISETARHLKEEGVEVFNLGGATTDNPGLHRFKVGFGASQIALETATFCPRSTVERKFHFLLHACRGLLTSH